MSHMQKFQGGPFVELFTTQGSDPLAKCKLSNPSKIKKAFDKNVKSFIINIEGGGTAATTKLQIPKEEKQPREFLRVFWKSQQQIKNQHTQKKTSVGILQRYIVIQVFIAKNSPIHIEFE